MKQNETNESKKRITKCIGLLEIQKAYVREQRTLICKMRGKVLVTEIPTACSGNFKDDKSYITLDAVTLNPSELLNKVFERN